MLKYNYEFWNQRLCSRLRKHTLININLNCTQTVKYCIILTLNLKFMQEQGS